MNPEKSQVVPIWLSNGQLMVKLMVDEINASTVIEKGPYRDTRKEGRFGLRRYYSRFLLI